MPGDVVQAQYEQLDDLARRFEQQADATGKMSEQVRRAMSALQQGGWIGKGSTAFTREMSHEVLPALRRLESALGEGKQTTLGIAQIMREAEEQAARLFSRENSPHTPSGAEETLIRLGSTIFELADRAYDTKALLAAPLLMLSLRQGSNYPGQIILRSPNWLKSLGISSKWLKGMAGVSENLTHIKTANLVGHIGRVGRRLGLIGGLISVGQGTFAVLSEWNRRSDEYAGYTTSRRISAATVDASLAVTPVVGEFIGGMAGTIAGAKLGLMAGGALGSAVPVIGTAIGAGAGVIVGGALGGFAGDWLGGQIGIRAANQVRNAGWREPAIDVLDRNVVAPVVSSVSSAWHRQTQEWANQLDLSQVSFSFR